MRQPTPDQAGDQAGDRAGGKHMVRVDPDIEELVPVFLEEIHEDLTAMQNSLAQGDYEAVQALGHKSKGTAGGYGFDQVSEICASVELAARLEDAAEAGRALEGLESYLSRVEVVSG